MKQKFYRYELWEDYQNGMYVNRNDDQKPVRVEQAVLLFRDIDALKEEMRYVAMNWKIAAEVNLTNPTVNHQAWLGQAACCHYCGCGDFETIEAWHVLTEDERRAANACADTVYSEWERKYEKENGVYQLALFEVGE